LGAEDSYLFKFNLRGRNLKPGGYVVAQVGEGVDAAQAGAGVVTEQMEEQGSCG